MALVILVSELIKLQSNGFVLVPSAIDFEICLTWINMIEDSFQNLAEEVDCTVDEYLLSVSAWDGRNPLVSGMIAMIQEQVTTSIQKIIGQPLELLEGKLMMKGDNCPWPTHAHQDISYRGEGGKKQYHFSSWISLNHIGAEQGPLEFLPESHLESISVYQDFLNPEFRDRRTLDEWRDKHQKIFANPGDMILFDSRVWHASSRWCAIPRRYALILRWVVPETPDINIPKSNSVGRTMYDFSEWLEKSLQILIGRGNLEGDALLRACIDDDSITPKISILLNRYMINRTAGNLHGGSAQRGMLWGPLAEVINAEIDRLSGSEEV